MGRLCYYSKLQSGQAPQESDPLPKKTNKQKTKTKTKTKKLASRMSSARYFPAFSFNTSIEIQMNHVAFLETAVTFGLRTKQA